MSVGLPNTTIKVSRTVPPESTDSSEDGYSRHTVASGVRAHLGSPKPRTTGGIDLSLSCDPVDLGAGDIVLDETTGIEYKVDWAYTRDHSLIPHTVARLSAMQ